MSTGEFKFTVLLNISSNITVNISDSITEIAPGGLIIIDNEKHSHKISSKSSSKPLFLFRNFIATVNKK